MVIIVVDGGFQYGVNNADLKILILILRIKHLAEIDKSWRSLKGLK